MKIKSTLGAALCCLSLSSWAFAQGSSETVAEALFNEGRKLMGEERYAEACEKFRASYELDRATGTQLNLALCYKKAGRTASAWVTYKSAAAAARAMGDKGREELAQNEAKGLEGELKYLTIHVPDEVKVDGLALKLDGAPVPSASWGLELPVDPGGHVLEASAPGFETGKQEFEATEVRSELEVAALIAAPEEPAASDETVEDDSTAAASLSTTGASTTPAWIAFGVGGAGLIAGAVGFLGYRSAVKDLEDQCDSRQQCPPEAEDTINKEKLMRTVSLAGVIVGGVGLATGATLLVLSGGEEEAQAGSVEAYAGLGELGLRGRF